MNKKSLFDPPSQSATYFTSLLLTVKNYQQKSCMVQYNQLSHGSMRKFTRQVVAPKPLQFMTKLPTTASCISSAHHHIYAKNRPPFEIQCAVYLLLLTRMAFVTSRSRSHLIMHQTIGLTDYYRTISDRLTG